MEMHERLKSSRPAAGFETARDAVERFGWVPTTYAGHENGSRGFRRDTALEYARAFRVAPEWLLYGKPGGEIQASTPPRAGFSFTQHTRRFDCRKLSALHNAFCVDTNNALCVISTHTAATP